MVYNLSQMIIGNNSTTSESMKALIIHITLYRIRAGAFRIAIYYVYLIEKYRVEQM